MAELHWHPRCGFPQPCSPLWGFPSTLAILRCCEPQYRRSQHAERRLWCRSSESIRCQWRATVGPLGLDVVSVSADGFDSWLTYCKILCVDTCGGPDAR